MNERDREAADDWMRDHLPDPATVRERIVVKDGRCVRGFEVVAKSEASLRRLEAAAGQPDPAEGLRDRPSRGYPRTASGRPEELIAPQLVRESH